MSVIEVDRLVRATTKPYPGAFLISGNKKITIWEGVVTHEPQNESNLFEIQLKDGFFYAKNFEIENLTQ